MNLYLLTHGGQAIQVTLLNEAQEESGTLMSGDTMGLDTFPAEGAAHFHVPDVEPGTGILAFEGVYSVSVGSPCDVFAPLAIRQ